MKRGTTVAVVAVVLALTVPASSWARTPGEIRRSYRAVVRELPCPTDDLDFPSPRDPSVAPLLARAWPLIAEWTAHYLNAHPAARSSDLASNLRSLDPKTGCTGSPVAWWSLGGSVTQLASGRSAAFLVKAGYAVVDTLFVVERRAARRYRVVWTLPTSGLEPDAAAWGDGELRFAIRPLPAAANGDARGYLIGTYFSLTSCCWGQGITIWEWQSGKLVPLLWKSVGVNRCDDVPVDSGQNVVFHAGLLEVGMRGHTKTVGTSCGDSDPRVVWQVHITPEGVEDLGERWEQPELQLADEVLDRVLRGLDVSELASPEAVESLQVLESKRDRASSTFLGMWNGRRVTPTDGGRRFDLNIMGVGAVTFAMVERDGRLYVQSAEVGPEW